MVPHLAQQNLQSLSISIRMDGPRRGEGRWGEGTRGEGRRLRGAEVRWAEVMHGGEVRR